MSSLSRSKYAKKTVLPNQWRELTISDSNLIAALEQFLSQTTHLAKDEFIDKVIVGEPVAGKYPLSVAILKRKEAEK